MALNFGGDSMILKNANVFGRIIDIPIENGKISNGADGEAFDLHSMTVIPGMVDVHIHGLCGIDTMDADFDRLSTELAKRGTTSFLPTAMTMDDGSLMKISNADTKTSGARVLGLHFEGPYISANRKGAQDERNIKEPNIRHFNKFKNVKMMTLAPEKANSMDFIRKVSDKCVISLGHTDCDKQTALNAFDSGAKCLTHMYNAMPPFSHRAPGPIGAAVEKNAYAQLICDGLHVDRSVVIAAYRTFGTERLVLISDSIRPAYCDDGEYNCGGLNVTMKDNVARLSDGTLAGSSACLFDCVKKAVSFGIPFYDAVKCASQTPAELIGVKKGRIEVGYDADLLVLDNEMNIKAVIIGGSFFENNL